MKIHTIGIDLGKTSFHLVGLNEGGEVVVRKRLSRAQLLRFTANRKVHLIGIGRSCLFRKKVNLSTCLAGQALGIKEVDDDIWLVSFMDYDLGYIDLEEKTLQPLNNPFGPKVLPMS